MQSGMFGFPGDGNIAELFVYITPGTHIFSVGSRPRRAKLWALGGGGGGIGIIISGSEGSGGGPGGLGADEAELPANANLTIVVGSGGAYANGATASNGGDSYIMLPDGITKIVQGIGGTGAVYPGGSPGTKGSAGIGYPKIYKGTDGEDGQVRGNDTAGNGGKSCIKMIKHYFDDAAGIGSTTNNGANYPPTGYGCGGAGGVGSASGTNGMSGLVIIEFL